MKYNQLTTEQYIERAKAIHGDTFDYSDTVYTSMDKRIIIRCRKHGIFECLAGNHVNQRIKSGCPYCAKKLVYKGETDLQSQYPEIAKHFDEAKNDMHSDEVFAHSNKKYWWKCDNGEQHSYQMCLNNKTTRNQGCPICNQSNGEQLVSRILDKYGITYKTQEWFPDLRIKHPLHFDFTLYQDNKWIGAIEFNGRQHYQPVKQWGGDEELADIKRRDLMKRHYCLSKGIPILCIAYQTADGFLSPEEEIIRFLQNLNLIDKEKIS
jgi:hypothetical protein